MRTRLELFSLPQHEKTLECGNKEHQEHFRSGLFVGTMKNEELEARLGLCCALPEELQDQLIALTLEKAARDGD